jgi:hypothetical protein
MLIRPKREPFFRKAVKRVFAQTPEELTRDVALNLFGEKGEELI